jgi:imidazolonepropionase-like amidohydrolase
VRRLGGVGVAAVAQVSRARAVAPAAIGIALAAAFFLALPEPGERSAAPAAGFAIRDARVFDGERVLPRATVLVRDGRIAAVGPDVPVPDGLAVVDGRGRTLLPGLIDAHAHAFDAALADALNFGVTTVLDMLGDPATLAELKPARESFAPVGHADLYGAGWAATVAGGHGTQFGLRIPLLATPGEAGPWVAARLAEGSDWIKILYEPRGPGGLGPPFPSIDEPTLRALVAAAHERARLAVVHVSRLGPAREALASGADGLVHVYADRPADEALLALVRERRPFVVPTLAVTLHFAGALDPAAFAGDPRIAPYLTPAQRAALAEPLPEPARLGFMRPEVPGGAVRELRDAGATILAGSDAPNPGTVHGATLHQELELLVRAGLTPLEALVAATAAPARRFRLADRGTIAPGQRADLVLVEGDPTADIAATRAIVAVWKNGAAVERRRYPERP